MDLIDVFKVIVCSALIGSVIVLLILSIKAVLKNKLNPIFHYYLWMILLIKLIVPFGPQTSLNILNLYEKFHVKSISSINIQDTQNNFANQVKNIGISELVELDDFQSPSKSETTNSISIGMQNKYNIEKVLCFIWIFVSVALIGILAIGYRRLRKIVRISIKDISLRHKKILNDCRSIMSIKTKVEIMYSTKINTPSLCGLIKPKILIPVSVAENVCDEQFKYIIMHELSHLKSKDIFINWITTLLSSIYWFNPIVLYGFYKMRQDCEIACDANTISYLAKDENIQYGNAMIRVLQLMGNSNRMVGTTSMIMNSSEIKRRIIMISKYKKGNIKSILIGVTVIAIIGVVGVGMNISKASPNKNITKTSVNNISSGKASYTQKKTKSDTTKVTSSLSSDIVIYNSHADESYPSGVNVTDVGEAINDKLVKEGLNSKFIKCEPAVEYIKSYENARNVITKNVENYKDAVLLDIHRDVAQSSKGNTKKILLTVVKDSPNYKSNKKFANQLLKEIKASSSNEIKVDIFEYKKGKLYFNQDLSNHALLIEVGDNKSSDSEIEKYTNVLVTALKNVINNQTNK